VPGQALEHELELVDAGDPRVGAGGGDQPHDGGPVDVARLDPVDEPAQRGEVEPRPVGGDGQRRARHARDRDARRHRRRRVDDSELHVPVALSQPRDLPHGRGEADLLGRGELQKRGQVACPAARQQYVLLGAQLERKDGLRHRTER
jgi:hypothetical protein